MTIDLAAAERELAEALNGASDNGIRTVADSNGYYKLCDDIGRNAAIKVGLYHELARRERVRQEPQTRIGPPRMEVLKVFATPGKPAALGRIGTILLAPPNSDGEILCTLTISKRYLAKLARKRHKKMLDFRKRKEDTA